MNTFSDIDKILESGQISNELDLERAIIADRKLRVLSKENSKFSEIRKKLRALIYNYENETWSTHSRITESKLRKSDEAEIIANEERIFFLQRKKLIRQKLNYFDLTQQDLGKILGHQNKSYISELINGIRSFTLKDLLIISKLLGIKLNDLIPPFISKSDQDKVLEAIEKMNNPKLNF
ncbi:helix-turn-helix domain-containing protein [Algoriphagus hitonicola]